jgi:hypothetical protein
MKDTDGLHNIVWDGQAYLLETDENGVTKVVCTQEPTEFGNLISQRRETS